MVTATTETIYTCDCGRRFRFFKSADACGRCPDCKEHVSDPRKHEYTHVASKLIYAERCEACEKIYREKWRERQAVERAEKLAKAVEITAEELGDNMVYVEDDDSWHESPEDAADHFYGEDHVPEFGFASTKITLELDAETILENALDGDFDEDAYDRINDLQGLQAFLTEWCDKERLVSYQADFSRKVRIKFAEGRADDE